MVRDYELMYIVRPELDEEALQAATESVERLITGAGGTVTQSTSWGRRRLAYEVKHLRDGHYMLLQVRLDGGQVAGIERALTISETVFRHLLVLQETPVEAEQPDDVDAEAARQAAVAVAGDDGAAADAAGATEKQDEEDAAEPTAVAAGTPASDAEEES